MINGILYFWNFILIFKYLVEIYFNIFNAVTLKVPSVRKTIMDKNDGWSKHLKTFSQCVCGSKIISFFSAKLLSQTCMTFLVFYFAKQSYVIDCFSHKTIKENWKLQLA